MSNKYPQWWDRTLTVYNKFDDPQTKMVKWYRTTLTNCFWRCVEEKFIVNGTVVNANVTVCRIPKNENFMERYLWEQLSDDDRAKHFTLSIGDMIVCGEVDDDIDEYQSGKRSTDFLTKYKRLQGCTLIGMAAINVGGGRANEHYLVRGS